MSAWSDFWQRRSTAAKLAAALGVALVLGLTAAAAVWTLRDDYQPLFADLDPRDAAAIAAELERMKVPYRVADDGATVLVPASSVHATRLKVMGQGLELKGTVGFEIFNNTDFGMTEFAQKINYQRALQGELARTIMALDEVKGARVHLVLPESGLLRRSSVRPKASIILLMRHGRRLEPAQIQGIQRLVAASVAEMDPGSVTVLDQEGVALSRPARPGEDADAVSGQLEAKKEVESYLSRKVAAVLDKAFGPGQAIVSVDVALNHDHVKLTREDVLHDGGAVLRRRQSTQASAPMLTAADGGTQAGRGPASSASEVDYQLGRKVEQVVSEPGSIRRISVGVVLSAQVPPREAESVKRVIAMAVGLDPRRGDALAVSWAERAAAPAAAPAPVARESARPLAPAVQAPPVEPWRADNAALAAAALAALAALTWSVVRRRRAPRPARLSAGERDKVLAELRTWMDAGGAR